MEEERLGETMERSMAAAHGRHYRESPECAGGKGGYWRTKMLTTQAIGGGGRCGRGDQALISLCSTA